jgi:hypothetical protein
VLSVVRFGNFETLGGDEFAGTCFVNFFGGG